MSTPLLPMVSAVLTVAADRQTAPATTGTRTSSATTRRGGNVLATAARGGNVPATTVRGGNVPGAMPRVASVSGTIGAAKPELTAEQKLALKHLHETAQQFESLFVNMLFKSMRAAAPQTSITGEKLSPAETTFTEMLDEKRSESMAQTGAFGIAKVLEDQLKASVLANPAQAAKTRLAPEGIL